MFVVDGGGVVGRVAAVHELHRDAELRQGVVEQVVGAAVEAGAADDVLAGAGDVEDRQRLGRLPGREAQGRDAALERRDALLEDARRGVHDPGVDVPELLEPEEPGGVRGVVEDVGGRGVDRDRAGVGRGVGDLAGVEGLGLGTKGAEAVRVEAHLVVLRGVCRGWSVVWSSRGPWGSSSAATRRLWPENKEAANPRWFAAPGPRLRDPRCHWLKVSAEKLGARPPNDGAAHACTSTRTQWCGSSGGEGWGRGRVSVKSRPVRAATEMQRWGSRPGPGPVHDSPVPAGPTRYGFRSAPCVHRSRPAPPGS